MRPCTSKTQFGCVVAYSSWDRPPPAGASLESAGKGQHVLCVNPAAPGGGAAPVTPMFLTTGFNEMGGVSPQILFAITSPWVSYPGSLQGAVHAPRRMAWLQVTKVAQGQAPGACTAPDRGLHTLDVNIALFELVGLVAGQTKAYL